jgi:hypothetical protein
MLAARYSLFRIQIPQTTPGLSITLNQHWFMHPFIGRWAFNSADGIFTIVLLNGEYVELSPTRQSEAA